MPTHDDEEVPTTVLLKSPLLGGDSPDEADELTSTGKLVCTDPRYLTPNSDREFWLTQREQTLGRGEQCTLRIQASDLSRMHARVTAFSNDWIIEDFGSRNGVYVNGTRIQSRCKVVSGDTIKLGRVPFRFELLDVAPSELVNVIPPQPKPKRVQQYPDDTIPLELSEDGELVDMRLLEKIKAKEKKTRASKTVAHARLVGVRADEDESDELDAAHEGLARALPAILEELVTRARDGDLEAAKACVQYYLSEHQAIPDSVDLSGSVSSRVKNTLSAMAERRITPGQSLQILQSLEIARDLLGKKGS